MLALQPGSVLDLGCGEGWLSAVLAEKGIAVTGTDVIPELIAHAAAHIQGSFHVTDYDAISNGSFRFQQPFDVIVSNFALLAKDSVDALLPALPQWLSPGGALIIQTLHPYTFQGTAEYVTGWKKGSWDGLGEGFTDPYDWYFRTLEDWLALLSHAGFGAVTVQDVRHPRQDNLLSVIFTCRIK